MMNMSQDDPSRRTHVLRKEMRTILYCIILPFSSLSDGYGSRRQFIKIDSLLAS